MLIPVLYLSLNKEPTLKKYYIPKIAKQKKAILTDSQSSLLTLNLIP